MKSAIVIVNYRTAECVERCLTSLEQEVRAGIDTSILVSDTIHVTGQSIAFVRLSRGVDIPG